MEQILDDNFSNHHLRYAGFWVRVGAYIIDLIILGVVQGIIGSTLISDIDPMQFDYFGIGGLIAILYYSLMESSEKQATIGKIALNLKVGDMNGNRISFMNALGRYLAKILSALILLIGFIMVAFDNKRQGLHDKLANTVVYHTK